MILTCQNCETRYSVDPNSLVPNGKTVRCAKCGHSWTEHPPADMPHTVEPESAAVALSRPPKKEYEDALEVPSVEDVTSHTNLPPRKDGGPSVVVPSRKMGAIIGWSAFVVIGSSLLGGGIFFRGTAMDVWPPSTKLYEVVGLAYPSVYALALGNVTPSYEREGETLILIVTGDISNITKDVQAVPRLRGAILDVQSREIFSWTFDSPLPELGAGETVAFVTRVPNSPEGGHDVDVTFTGKDG